MLDHFVYDFSYLVYTNCYNILDRLLGHILIKIKAIVKYKNIQTIIVKVSTFNSISYSVFSSISYIVLHSDAILLSYCGGLLKHWRQTGL